MSTTSADTCRRQFRAPGPDQHRAQRECADLPGRLPAARIRQAQASQGQVLGAGRRDRARRRSGGARGLRVYDAAQKAIQSKTVAVQANELALEGAAPNKALVRAPFSTSSMPSRSC